MSVAARTLAIASLMLAQACGPLTGTRPYLALGSEALYLPGATQGQTAEADLTLYNLGGGALEISQLRLEPLDASGSWSMDHTGAATLLPDAALVLKVRHHRASTGARSRARLALLSNDLQRPQVSVKLTAPGSTANLSATPGRVDFGAVETGKSSARTVRIVNLGRTAARALELVWSGQSAAGDFSAALPAGALAPTETLELQLSYTPRGGGSDATTLQLRWQEGAGSAGGSLDLPLTGRQDLQAPD
jgi:hypothetical protein